MPEFHPESFVRPWIEGVAVVANLIHDAVFDVTGVPPSAMDAAVETVRGHDRAASPDLRGRLSSPGAAVVAQTGDDWIAGFEDAMRTLAGAVDFGDVKSSPFAVGIVGLPLTRNEWDSRADADAVSHLVSDGLGLTVASCWPARGSIGDLAAIARAGLILALPYGRQAARMIASRTGARVVDVGLPLGFDGTASFVKAVGAATGRDERADEFVERELSRIVPRFEWVVPHSLLNRRVGLVGDAAFVQAAAYFLGEVGCDVCRYAVTGSGSWAADLTAIVDDDPAESMTLMIGNSDLTTYCVDNDMPFLETGWPCVRFHAFYPRPYLGFDGSAALLQDMVNRMSFYEIMTSWKNTVINEEGQ